MLGVRVGKQVYGGWHGHGCECPALCVPGLSSSCCWHACCSLVALTISWTEHDAEVVIVVTSSCSIALYLGTCNLLLLWLVGSRLLLMTCLCHQCHDLLKINHVTAAIPPQQNKGHADRAATSRDLMDCENSD